MKKVLVVLLMLSFSVLFAFEEDNFIDFNKVINKGESVLFLKEGELWQMGIPDQKQVRLSETGNSIKGLEYSSEFKIAYLSLASGTYETVYGPLADFLYKVDFQNKTTELIFSLDDDFPDTEDMSLSVISLSPLNPDRFIFFKDGISLYNEGEIYSIEYDMDSYFSMIGRVLWKDESFIIQFYGKYEGSSHMLFHINNGEVVADSLTENNKIALYVSGSELLGFNSRGNVIRLDYPDDDTDYSGTLSEYDPSTGEYLYSEVLSDSRFLFMAGDQIFSFADVFSEEKRMSRQIKDKLYLISFPLSQKLFSDLSWIPEGYSVTRGTLKEHRGGDLYTGSLYNKKGLRVFFWYPGENRTHIFDFQTIQVPDHFSFFVY